MAQEWELVKQTTFTRSEVYSKRKLDFLRTATKASLTDAEWKNLIDDLKKTLKIGRRNNESTLGVVDDFRTFLIQNPNPLMK